jgi:hypothetical protein
MELLDLIETIRAEEATPQKLFGAEGTGMRHNALRNRPDYAKKLAEAAKFVAEVVKGRRPMRQLQEAMTTSDFPNLFGDILDRQVLASYREAPAVFQSFTRIGTVRDFRSVKRFGVHGADQVLGEVTEHGEYPTDKIVENSPYTYAVKKYGRKLGFSWEAIVNDDMETLTDAPQRLGRAARRSEQKFVTQLYVDANGPHASLYTVGNANKVTSNPVLSITALQTAFTVLAAQKSEEGEPIVLDLVELVVPPALEITALNILNATQLVLDDNAALGTKKTNVATLNWMKNRVRLNVDPYIPIVAGTANGNTSWFLFGNPDNGRPALELGHLRGHEEPEIFQKAPNAVRVGGGAEEFDFDTDTTEFKVRHVFGGARMDPKVTVASNGSGV